MIICQLESQGLFGYIEHRWDSYVVRVYRHTKPKIQRVGDPNYWPDPIYVMSFGNGIKAEDRLIELLEHPAWTLLKYS
jgi:hypothetical protein